MPFPVIMGAAAACITMKNVIRSLPAEKGERAGQRTTAAEERRRAKGAEIGWRRMEDGAVEVAEGREHLYCRSLSASSLFLEFFPRFSSFTFPFLRPRQQSSFSRSALAR